MAQHTSGDAPVPASAEEQPELVGYTALPNLLLQALGGENGSTYSVVLFIARHTLGRQVKIGEVYYRVKEVCLSLDEFRYGRRKRDGSRMSDTSGLTNDAAIVRGCQAALAHQLIQVVDTGARGVHVYTLADRFWGAAGFTTALKMLADPRVPASFTAYKMIAVGSEQEPHPLPSDDKKSATAVESALSIASTAHITRAVPLQNVSSTAHKIVAVTAGQPAQDKVRGERKHREKHRKENIDRTFDTTDVQNENQKRKNTDTLSLAERLTLVLEQQGEHQRSESASFRQRAEPLDTRQESASAQPRSPMEATPSTPTALPIQQSSVPSAAAERTPHHQTQGGSPASEDPAEIAARRLRLLALQQELAQLKRTPSMQLLARRRIPRLEEAIKHLIASLAESA